ncbi:unnamed protein product [Nippostrongylus brasiliensis]|uniref:DDE_Tnp_1_7 domain-containing protein n=1 Tax=Nippostrongylus brasiliensis TaxID=27835 RepID=A0A0N4XQN3_NIPBR|nr:unnamed protein product [Nippostrongylus brasiliensis]
MKFFPPFSPNDRYPQLCEGATLHFDLKRQLHVVATRDIPCGEVVCLDVGKVISLDDGVCRYCLSRLTENRKNWYYFRKLDFLEIQLVIAFFACLAHGTNRFSTASRLWHDADIRRIFSKMEVNSKSGRLHIQSCNIGDCGL